MDYISKPFHAFIANNHCLFKTLLHNPIKMRIIIYVSTILIKH